MLEVEVEDIIDWIVLNENDDYDDYDEVEGGQIEDKNNDALLLIIEDDDEVLEIIEIELFVDEVDTNE